MTTRTNAEPFVCATCRAEIAGRPTFHVGLAFCCAGCVADGPCICSYDEEPAGETVRHCLDVRAALEPRYVPVADRALAAARR